MEMVAADSDEIISKFRKIFRGWRIAGSIYIKRRNIGLCDHAGSAGLGAYYPLFTDAVYR